MGHLDHIADRVAAVSPDWEAQITAGTPDGHRVALELENDNIALGVETIREGHLLHYGTPRVVRPTDTSGSILIGDHCYASGLCDVAASGDLEAIRTLAQLVAEVASVDPSDPLAGEAREACWKSSMETLRQP